MFSWRGSVAQAPPASQPKRLSGIWKKRVHLFQALEKPA
jgi:hypothetical protein